MTGKAVQRLFCQLKWNKWGAPTITGTGVMEALTYAHKDRRYWPAKLTLSHALWCPAAGQETPFGAAITYGELRAIPLVPCPMAESLPAPSTNSPGKAVYIASAFRQARPNASSAFQKAIQWVSTSRSSSFRLNMTADVWPSRHSRSLFPGLNCL